MTKTYARSNVFAKSCLQYLGVTSRWIVFLIWRAKGTTLHLYLGSFCNFQSLESLEIGNEAWQDWKLRFKKIQLILHWLNSNSDFLLPNASDPKFYHCGNTFELETENHFGLLGIGKGTHEFGRTIACLHCHSNPLK